MWTNNEREKEREKRVSEREEKSEQINCYVRIRAFKSINCNARCMLPSDSTTTKENYESNQTFRALAQNTNNRLESRISNLESRIIDSMKRSHCYFRFSKVKFISCQVSFLWFITFWLDSIRFTINSSVQLCLYCIQFFIVVFVHPFPQYNKDVIWFIP